MRAFRIRLTDLDGGSLVSKDGKAHVGYRGACAFFKMFEPELKKKREDWMAQKSKDEEANVIRQAEEAKRLEEEAEKEGSVEAAEKQLEASRRRARDEKRKKDEERRKKEEAETRRVLESVGSVPRRSSTTAGTGDPADRPVP